MFNLVKDNFDENSDDILDSINKMIQNSKMRKTKKKLIKTRKKKKIRKI